MPKPGFGAMSTIKWMGRSLYGAAPFRNPKLEKNGHRKEGATVPADGERKSRIPPRAPRWGYLQWGLKLLMVAAMISRAEAATKVNMVLVSKLQSEVCSTRV